LIGWGVILNAIMFAQTWSGRFFHGTHGEGAFEWKKTGNLDEYEKTNVTDDAAMVLIRQYADVKSSSELQAMEKRE